MAELHKKLFHIRFEQRVLINFSQETGFNPPPLRYQPNVGGEWHDQIPVPR